MEKISSFSQFLNNIEEYKKQYQEFSCTPFDLKPLVAHKRKWKKMIYSIECLKIYDYKKNIIWEYLNNDISKEEAMRILGYKL